MNLCIYCFVLSMKLPVLWASPRSKFASVRKNKCIFGGDSAWPQSSQTRRLGEISYDLIKKMQQNLPETNVGPKRHKYYDPTKGYEAYWEGGTWVMDPDYKMMVEGKEVKADPDQMCDTTCSFMYKSFGPVCAVDKKYNHESFNNYCEMRRSDCDNRKDLTIAYRGYCTGPLTTQEYYARDIVAKAKSYLQLFEEKYGKRVQ